MSFRGCLHGQNVIPTTTYPRQAYLTTILQRNAFDTAGSGIHCIAGHGGPHESISIRLALDKHTPTHEFTTIVKSDFPGRDNVFTSLAIPKLTEFGGSGGVQMSGGGEEGRDVLPTGCLSSSLLFVPMLYQIKIDEISAIWFISHYTSTLTKHLDKPTHLYNLDTILLLGVLINIIFLLAFSTQLTHHDTFTKLINPF